MKHSLKYKMEMVAIFEGKPNYVTPSAFAISQGINPMTFAGWFKEYKTVERKPLNWKPFFFYE